MSKKETLLWVESIVTTLVRYPFDYICGFGLLVVIAGSIGHLLSSIGSPMFYVLGFIIFYSFLICIRLPFVIVTAELEESS